MSATKNNNTYKVTSFLAGNNSEFINEFYADYLNNPQNLPPGWKEFFDGLKDKEEIISKTIEGPSWGPKKNIKKKVSNKELTESKNLNKQEKINPSILEEATKDSVRAIMLIRAYRIRGHLTASLDPLSLQQKDEHPELKPETYASSKSRCPASAPGR